MRHRISILILAASCVFLSSTSRAATPDPALGKNGMVASANALATDVGRDILQQGGNAVDAAIATALVISVVEPFSTGLGGGGFAVVRFKGAIEALDFREVAPAAATSTMYVGKDGKVDNDAAVNGAKSVAVPGTAAGLHALHKAHGKLRWDKLVAPAQRIARQGFAVGARYAEGCAERLTVLSRFASTRAVFLRKDGTCLQPGERLVQRDLANSLAALQKNPRALNEGPVAAAIVAAVQKEGGILTVDDLQNHLPRATTPLCGMWEGYRLCTMPPPSSGGVHLLQILQLSGLTLAGAPAAWHVVDDVHRLIEAMRLAYADRAEWLGDPAFVDVPTDALLKPAYLTARKARITAKAMRSADVKAGTPAELGLAAGTKPGQKKAKAKKESNDTSHLSVVDKDQNAVSMTFTVNYGFGSGLIAAGTGILMNDEMDDFAAAPGVPNSYGLVGGDANAIAPGKVPLSSMTPLIVEKDGVLVMTAGAPGGSTIITTTLQTFLNVVRHGMDCQQAVSAPRIHQQWLPEETRIEAFGLDDETRRQLEARGHRFKQSEGWGNAMCIRRRADGVFEGAADPRGEGTARGFN
jgi:gamma-glutamyltranspeptidase / glutathione hydrolase